MGNYGRNYGRNYGSYKVPYGKAGELRLRAEVLLVCDERGEIAVTADEREQLIRICTAPNDEDELWLGRFDERTAALAAATTFTNDELSACAEREVERRLRAYPRHVAAKRPKDDVDWSDVDPATLPKDLATLYTKMRSAMDAYTEAKARFEGKFNSSCQVASGHQLIFSYGDGLACAVVEEKSVLTEKEARREIAMMERIAEYFRGLDISEGVIE